MLNREPYIQEEAQPRDLNGNNSEPIRGELKHKEAVK